MPAARAGDRAAAAHALSAVLLSGLRVLELSQLIAAPLCGLQLLDLGAEVVKVEPPEGEAGRRLPPFAAGSESLWFHALNRGKRGVVVERDDAATLRRLVGWADVVIDNVAGAVSIAFADVAPERPELVAKILRDVPDFDLRSLVRPGIAGLAQVSAEYDSRPEVKLRYDLMYMCDWSVWLDLRLMFRAVSSSLAGTGR